MPPMVRKRPACSDACDAAPSLEDVYGSRLRSQPRQLCRSTGQDDTSLPAGPCELADLYDWPQRVLQQLLDPTKRGAASRRDRLIKNGNGGISLHSDRSGLGTAEIAVRPAAQWLRRARDARPHSEFGCVCLGVRARA
jgi:hypothetical protein